MKFEKYSISEQIKNNLETLGFKRPTDIQFKVLPAVLKGEDVLAIAQTGTGKTAAFVIPLLHMLQKRSRRLTSHETRCIVLVPTHELAIQIENVFLSIGKDTGLVSLGIYGGVDQKIQIEALTKGVDILIATPGRMFDLHSQGHILFSSVEFLVLDEADHMLDLGFIHDIRQFTKLIPDNHQTLFFSATINEQIKDLAYSLVKNPLRIQLSPKDPVSKNVTHAVLYVAMDDKRFFLERFIKEHPKSKILVFVRTQVRAERVLKALERVNIESESIHGGKVQLDRSEILNRFKDNSNKVLIATDVSARGIDIPEIKFIINYDIPENPENYVHRIGRTGRGVQKGSAVSFCSKEEEVYLNLIETYIQKEIKVLEMKPNDYESTIEWSDDHPSDWKKLLADENAFIEKKKSRKHNK